jgi:predicted naringenin-chalcone synthase
MGCNAGLNGLTAIDAWTRANPGKLAVMVCAEICSAAYVIDETMQTSVVNSLFGDGASAAAMIAVPDSSASGKALAPTVVGFASAVVSDALDAMKYTWDEAQNKFSFTLAQDVPYVVGAHAEEVIDRLLRPAGLRRHQIAHWVIHSGGKKVIDAVKINLGLTTHDVRHTISVLNDYGNVSSGSFLFSYERLLEEGKVERGDYGVMMTMGPGTTIETALLRW